MTQRELKPSPKTTHWGYFDATLKPVMTVKSGDRVTIETVSGGPSQIPKPGGSFNVPPELLEIHAAEKGLPFGPHIMTGPIAIDGAKPGDVLEVKIVDIALRTNWGYNLIRPLAGTLPDDFTKLRLLTIPIDLEKKIGKLPWGLDLPLSPFFGNMGVAPPEEWGRINSMVPRAHGGNLDNKELVPGSTLYLPVWVEGANFSVGDGHGVQGDGEVCVTAIETALRGTFEFVLHKGMGLTYPRAETPTHYITMHMDPDLDICAQNALRDMIKLIGEKKGLSREDAYTLCSLAADLRVTQTVNGSKGIHVMLAKRLLA